MFDLSPWALPAPPARSTARRRHALAEVCRWIRTALAAPWLIVEELGSPFRFEKSGLRVVDGSNFYFISAPLPHSEIASFRLKLSNSHGSAIHLALSRDSAAPRNPLPPIIVSLPWRHPHLARRNWRSHLPQRGRAPTALAKSAHSHHAHLAITLADARIHPVQ